MEIRHIDFGDRDRLATQHSELVAQHPKLAEPSTVGRNDAAADFPYLFYAIVDGRVASHFRSFPDRLIEGGRSHQWAWNGDLYTNPDFRARGIAQKLVHYQLNEFARRNIIWGGVFSSPAALRLYRRMGFSIPGFAPRLCLLGNVRPFLSHYTSNRFAVSVGGVTFDAAFAVAQRLLFRSPHHEYKYRIELINGKDFAVLLAHRPIWSSEKFYWGGDAGWFEARLSVRSIDNVYLVHRPDERDACAFLIVRDRVMKSHLIKGRYRGVRMMSVMECGRFDRAADVPNALVTASIILLMESKADLLDFVTSAPDIERSARRRGFLPMGDGMSFAFMAPPGNAFHGMETKPSDWHLSHYCGDAFGFE